MIKAMTNNDILSISKTSQLIHDRFANIITEIQELDRNDFHTKALLQGELEGIKYVINLLSKTTII